MPFDYSFDATQFDPVQGIGSHPVGIFDATISSTVTESTKDNSGGLFKVEFTTASGHIFLRYNLWNQNPKAVEIAHKQLSALCYATGVFKLDFKNDGAALRNARLKIEVGYQKGEEPTAEKPQGGYVEVKRVLDVNGNEPGRAPAPAPHPQQGMQPQGQAPVQPNGSAAGWGTQPQAPQAPPPPNPAPQQGWTPGPTQGTQEKPPWATK